MTDEFVKTDTYSLLNVFHRLVSTEERKVSEAAFEDRNLLNLMDAVQ
jgi:hypothetical protein